MEDSNENKKQLKIYQGSSQKAFQNSGHELKMQRNVIIVNQVPEYIDQERFISIFSKYGKIEYVHLPTKIKQYSECIYYHEFARITFATEEHADKVFKASLERNIKYDDHVLMITQVSDNFCPIENLPDLCLKEIFLNLTSPLDKLTCEFVSSRWKNLAEKSWSNITEIKNTEKEKETIIRAKNSLRNVSTTIYSDPDDILIRLAQNCTQIQKFSAWAYCCGFYENIHHLRSLIRRNPNLRSITLDFDMIEVKERIKLTDVIPEKLETLDLKNNIVKVEMENPMDFSRFKNLKVLSINFFLIELRGFENLVSLRQLKIISSHIHLNGNKKMLHLTNLEHLAIPHCQISSHALGTILRNNKRLKYLDISYIDQTDNSSLQCIQQLPDLQVLVAEGLNYITNMHFVNLKTIKAIVMNSCPLICDRGIKVFFNTACNIQSLYICFTSVTLSGVMMANRWTQNSGKPLTLCVSSHVYDDYKNSNLVLNDKLNLLSWTFDDWICETGQDHWFEEAWSDTCDF